MKKASWKVVLSLCLAMVIVASLAGCGGTAASKEQSQPAASDSKPAQETKAPDATKPAEAKDQKKLVFGYIAYNMKDIWNMYGAQAFEYAAKQKGVDVVVLDSENNLEKSVSCMQQLIDKKVDGISIFPISPDQAATLVRMANEAKIPITVENLKLPENSGNFISIVACQYDDIGYAAIKYISEKWTNSKVLYVAGAKGGGVYETYKVGVDKALNEFKGKVELIDTIHGDWETEKAMNVTQNYIQSGKKFDVIFANNDLMAKGCYNALKEANLAGKIKIVSTGGAPEGLQMIKDGIEDANMTAPVSIQGLVTFKNLWQFKNGKTPEKFIPLPIIPVDKGNLDQAISWEVDEKAVKQIKGLD